MKPSIQLQVIAFEIFGGFLILASLWMDEILNIHDLFLQSLNLTREMDELILETGLSIIGILIMVAGTLILFIRLRKLESYIVMCAWCRKVKLDGSWISFEDYLVQKQHTETSHGICSTCAEEQIRKYEGRPKK